jgi:UDP:flavonoid glycosyltransferase YjiC (YdhE family)
MAGANRKGRSRGPSGSQDLMEPAPLHRVAAAAILDPMSRFMFVVPPQAGHAYPAAAVAETLSARGHEVAWVGSAARLRPILGPDATVYPAGQRGFRSQRDVGLAAVKSLWEGFVVPFARFILPATDSAVQAFQPDVVVADGVALAGAIVAQRNGVPWVTLSGTLELSQSLARFGKLDAWVMRQRAAVWAAAGLPGQEVRFSPYLVIGFTSPLLMTGVTLPAHAELVGPALATRHDSPDFPWDWLDPARRHVLVTVGTLAEDVAAGPASFYSRALRALGALGDRLQAIMVTPAAVPDPAGHILAAGRVPLIDLMPQLDVVVCHGGLNTVCEALAHSVPVIVAPIRWDQPFNAAQVAGAGAGIRVNFGRASADQLRTAVTTALDDPAYRGAAARIAASFAAAGGRRRAADLIERLAKADIEPCHEAVS